jgi:hypothetical protein
MDVFLRSASLRAFLRSSSSMLSVIVATLVLLMKDPNRK